MRNKAVPIGGLHTRIVIHNTPKAFGTVMIPGWSCVQPSAPELIVWSRGTYSATVWG